MSLYSKPKKKIHPFPAMQVRIEVNADQSQVLWNVRVGFDTHFKGFAKTRLEAMQKATMAVETAARVAAYDPADNIVPIIGREGDE